MNEGPAITNGGVPADPLPLGEEAETKFLWGALYCMLHGMARDTIVNRGSETYGKGYFRSSVAMFVRNHLPYPDAAFRAIETHD